MTDFCLCDGLPTFFALNLCVGEQGVRFLVEEDGIGVHAVLFESGLQFRPDGAMALFVFGVLVRMHGHLKGFANERHGFVRIRMDRA